MSTTLSSRFPGEDFILSVTVNTTKEKAFSVLTDFKRYSKWTDLLDLKIDEQLAPGSQFEVTISAEKFRERFTATVVSKGDYAFAARQIVGFPWFFQATHHFIVEDASDHAVRLVQRWQLEGLISKLFRRKIHQALGKFSKMNDDFKKYLEAKN